MESPKYKIDDLVWSFGNVKNTLIQSKVVAVIVQPKRKFSYKLSGFDNCDEISEKSLFSSAVKAIEVLISLSK